MMTSRDPRLYTLVFVAIVQLSEPLLTRITPLAIERKCRTIFHRILFVPRPETLAVRDVLAPVERAKISRHFSIDLRELPED
jgi:hypothetical protein